MSKTKKRNITQAVLVILLAISIVCIWLLYFTVGSNNFNSTNAVSIYGTVVQGMSGLLSVSIAVIIFRIQSLENRLHSLEQSTLNYIVLITNNTYPKWLPVVEEYIRSGTLIKRYYERRKELDDNMEREIEENLNSQQRRLMESLNEHVSIEQTIQKTRKGAFWSFLLLILPILVSLLLLMISDSIPNWFSFYFVSFVILLSVYGVFSLILTAIGSTTKL